MASKEATTKKRDTNKAKLGRKKNVREAAKTLKPENPTKNVLSPAEQKFCKIYASDVEFFGNGTQSYIQAFNVHLTDQEGKKVPEGKKGMTRGAVSEAARKLLLRSDILTRIDEEMEELGFNDQHADKTLSFLMNQKADLRVALGAAAEYNKLKSRIVQREAHFHGFAADDMSDEELQDIIKKQEAFFQKK